MTHALLLACMLSGSPAEAQQVPLEYKVYRTWDITLPAEQFARVSGGFSNVTCTGDEFKAKLDGTALEIDTDGDGKPDTKVVGKKDDAGNKSALVTLSGVRDGKEFRYTARLVDNGKGWQFAASGAMVGMIDKTKVQLIDQNNNGNYNDIGEDAMIVGRSKIATFLSQTVNVGGELFTINVSADGTNLEYSPFEGEIGTLDLKSEMETQGKLVSAIVKSTDGQHCFDLARVRSGMKVPAGDYRLQSGQLGLAKAAAFVRAGRMKAIEVNANETTKVAWGGPLKGEFLYQRQGVEVGISPADVTYYGKAGEEYKMWDPIGKSPTFVVKSKETGETLIDAKFPGSS